MGIAEMKRLLLLVLVAVAVTGCGRKGPLEPPPAAAASGQTADEEPKGSNKRFVLDPLI